MSSDGKLTKASQRYHTAQFYNVQFTNGESSYLRIKNLNVTEPIIPFLWTSNNRFIKKYIADPNSGIKVYTNDSFTGTETYVFILCTINT